MTADEKFNEKMNDKLFAEMYNSRPEQLKAIIRQYPFDTYRVKEDAPYALTPPGTIVQVRTYATDNQIRVLVYAKDLLPTALEYIKSVCNNTGVDFEKKRTENVTSFIEPKWLEEYDTE